jgi:hypothetical protein
VSIAVLAAQPGASFAYRDDAHLRFFFVAAILRGRIPGMMPADAGQHDVSLAFGDTTDALRDHPTQVDPALARRNDEGRSARELKMCVRSLPH